MTRTAGRRWAVCVALALLPSACAGQADQNDSLAYEGTADPVREPQLCTVTRVVDGDTLECATLGRVRLIGIDTPERAQEPFGTTAAAALASLIPRNGEVLLEDDVERRDQYGRALRYVWVDGRMVNWLLVRSGYAVLLTYPPNVQYVEWFRSAQEAARDSGSGLWSVDGFECTPLDFRRGACR